MFSFVKIVGVKLDRVRLKFLKEKLNAENVERRRLDP